MSAVQSMAAAADQNNSWWRGGVIYQIYPRSYRDTTGNGIGDLNGITEKLPYIASLGVDAVWISPFFLSPMKDYGYDVQDYRAVDPMFGTLADFDRLLDAAHKLGLRIMIDLVLSHTSDQHAWFQQSRMDRTNSKADWYVWADPKPDGTAPNNWLSIFGGSAWQWDPRREQYYLHNFLVSQPDLNFHNTEVQDELLEVARFWLDRGVDGFRLDTINFYFHDDQLRDNPALPAQQRNASIAPSVNPYNYQEHLYSKNRPENLPFLERLRAVMNTYDARACVGEIGDAQRGLELLGEYTKGDIRAHMSYAFEFLAKERMTAPMIVSHFDRFTAVASDGWACWALSNHDVVRHKTRWDLSDEAVRAYATLLMCLRGSACIYQGEELGLSEADVALEDLQDPYGIEFWPEFKGRDGCRTPMVWESNGANGGFSDAQKTWLPVGGDHVAKAVNAQDGHSKSMLSHYRAAIALRQRNAVLREGDQPTMHHDGDVLLFERTDGQARVVCAFNLSDAPATVALPEGSWQNIGAAVGAAEPQTKTVTLGAWQCLIAQKTD